MVRISLLSAPWRAVAAVLAAVAVVTLPTYLLATLVLPPVPSIVMIRSFLVGSALPAAVAWGILRAFAGGATVRDGVLHLERADLVLDAPKGTIVAVRPWWLPLPRSGLTLRLDPPVRAPMRIATDDPGALLDLLALDRAPARRHPTVVWAATRRRRPWYGALMKFVVFGALPSGLLFYTHQHIAYGGTFGQYYLEGAAPYVSTLVQYWATTTILLVSWASVWRGAGETLVWTAALAGPRPAGAARRVVEVACGLAYWVGVPALLALRYLA